MRRVIQISGPMNNLVALCDDGTVWWYKVDVTAWVQLPPVPGQPGTDEAAAAALDHDRLAVELQERAQQARRDRFQGMP
jgi:hypothetical protein